MIIIVTETRGYRGYNERQAIYECIKPIKGILVRSLDARSVREKRKLRKVIGV